ncbi:MAG: hypothetical protein ACO3NZ_12740 [Pirellulales bacterium]
MFFMPRYTSTEHPDWITGYQWLHPWVYEEIRGALEPAGNKKRAKVRVNLEGDGENGKPLIVNDFVNLGPSNTGEDFIVDYASINTMTFWLRKGKIVKYRVDSGNDKYDVTVKPRRFNPATASPSFPKNPILLADLWEMDDLYKQGKFGEMYVYNDTYLWPSYGRYADVGQPGVSIL